MGKVTHWRPQVYNTVSKATICKAYKIKDVKWTYYIPSVTCKRCLKQMETAKWKSYFGPILKVSPKLKEKVKRVVRIKDV